MRCELKPKRYWKTLLIWSLVLALGVPTSFAQANLLTCLVDRFNFRVQSENSENRLIEAWKLMEEGNTLEGEAVLTGIEDRLRNGVVSSGGREAGGQSGAAFIYHLEDGTTVVFKTDHTFARGQTYKHEIAAYVLDRLFGFNLVPPTVERSIGGRSGSVQLFVNRAREPMTDLATGVSTTPELRMLDVLLAEGDRHSGNILIVGRGQSARHIAIDHSSSFGSGRLAPTEQYLIRHKPSREFIERWMAPSDADIRRALEPYITSNQIDALIVRRQEIIKEWRRLKFVE